MPAERRPDGGKELALADGLRDVVVLALVAERARHAAAAGVEIDDLAAGDAAEQSQGRAVPTRAF